MPASKNKQIIHFLEDIGVALRGLVELENANGEFHNISLFKHAELGRVLVIDGEIHHVEAWASLYHEPLIHLPASFVPCLSDVLILGGGSFYAAHEVLKYKSVRRVVMIDHEPRVLEMMSKHYRHARECVEDSRLVVINKDAYDEMSQQHGKFDLIINDGLDLLNINNRRSDLRRSSNNQSIFHKLSNLLSASGVCADVIFRHVFELDRVQRTLNILQKNNHLALSLIFLPEYHGVLHVLSIWGRKTSKVKQCLKQPCNHEQKEWIVGSSKNPCKYFNPRFLSYYLHLPAYIRSPLKLKRCF